MGVGRCCFFRNYSHTDVASRVIRSSFRKFRWKALLGHAVRDKFATKTGAASFRGLSNKGVALASKWPCYDVVPGNVPSEVWQGVDCTWDVYMWGSCLYMC